MGADAFGWKGECPPFNRQLELDLPVSLLDRIQSGKLDTRLFSRRNHSQPCRRQARASGGACDKPRKTSVRIVAARVEPDQASVLIPSLTHRRRSNDKSVHSLRQRRTARRDHSRSRRSDLLILDELRDRSSRVADVRNEKPCQKHLSTV